MQIQVNLLPGGNRKGKSAAGSSLKLGAAFTSLADKVKDPWLLGSATAVVLAVAVVGLLFTTQQASAGELDRRLETAVRDSTRLTTVLEARRIAAAERDSVHRQVQIIRTIDDNRYVWAHLLDEISRALPSFTWLTSVEQTSTPELPPGAQPAATDASARSARPNARAAAADTAKPVQDSIVVHQPVTFRVTGQTVDMQALTQFMKDLEASPFVMNVMLLKSEIVVIDGKDLTEFQLDAEYEVPPTEMLRTEPLVVPVR